MQVHNQLVTSCDVEVGVVGDALVDISDVAFESCEIKVRDIDECLWSCNSEAEAKVGVDLPVVHAQ